MMLYFASRLIIYIKMTDGILQSRQRESREVTLLYYPLKSHRAFSGKIFEEKSISNYHV